MLCAFQCVTLLSLRVLNIFPAEPEFINIVCYMLLPPESLVVGGAPTQRTQFRISFIHRAVVSLSNYLT